MSRPIELPEGMRPHPSQVNLPLTEVRKWWVDSSGHRAPDGTKLRRARWTIKGPLRAAIETRKMKLAQLAAGLLPSPKDPTVLAAKAEAKLAKMGLGPITAKTPLKEYVERKYIPWCEAGNIGEDTITVTRQRLNAHILPVLGDWSLEACNDIDAENALKAYIDGREKLKKATSKNGCLLNLSGILKHASTPRHHKGGKPPLDRKHQFTLYKETEKEEGTSLDLTGQLPKGYLRHKRYSPADVAKLLHAARNMPKEPMQKHHRWVPPHPSWWFICLGFGLYLGCRPAEASARRWCDYKDGRLQIDSQISARTKKFKRTTKNGVTGSQRLSPEMVEALDALKAATDPKPEDFILGVSGPGELRERFALITRIAFGEEHTRYHRLRHTFGSSLADAGVAVEVIQGLMRHSRINTTFGYITADDERANAAADALAKLYGGSK